METDQLEELAQKMDELAQKFQAMTLNEPVEFTKMEGASGVQSPSVFSLLGHPHNNQQYARRSINRVQQQAQQTQGILRFRKVPQAQSEHDSLSHSQQMLLRPVCQESATNMPMERNQQESSANVCQDIREWSVEQLD